MYLDTNLSFYFKQLTSLRQKIEIFKAKPIPADLYELRRNYRRLNGVVDEFMHIK